MIRFLFCFFSVSIFTTLGATLDRDLQDLTRNFNQLSIAMEMEPQDKDPFSLGKEIVTLDPATMEGIKTYLDEPLWVRKNVVISTPEMQKAENEYREKAEQERLQFLHKLYDEGKLDLPRLVEDPVDVVDRILTEIHKGASENALREYRNKIEKIVDTVIQKIPKKRKKQILSAYDGFVSAAHQKKEENKNEALINYLRKRVMNFFEELKN